MVECKVECNMVECNNALSCTSIRHIMGRLFFEPIMGHSVSSQNGCEDDRLSICPFTRLFSIVFAVYLCSYYF